MRHWISSSVVAFILILLILVMGGLILREISDTRELYVQETADIESRLSAEIAASEDRLNDKIYDSSTETRTMFVTQISNLKNRLPDEVADSTVDALASELERGKQPTLQRFPEDISEVQARAMFETCLTERFELLLGSLSYFISDADFSDLYDAFIGDTSFSDGELSPAQEIGFLGAFMGCWTLAPEQSLK